jgi:hypothetical protein
MKWDWSGGGDTGSLKGLGQVCRVQMIVRVQNKSYDELSVLWTRGEHKGGNSKGEHAKSVGQMTK